MEEISLPCQFYAWSRVGSSIQGFGLTDNGDSIYVRTVLPEILFIKIKNEIKNLDSIYRYIESRYNPDFIYPSALNKTVLLLVNCTRDILNDFDILDPTFSHKEYTNLVDWFFNFNNIRPYSGIVITAVVENLGKRYTSCKFNLIVPYNSFEAASTDIIFPKQPNRIYWDIESYSSTGSFTDAKIPGDFISNISTVVQLRSGKITGNMFTSLAPIQDLEENTTGISMRLFPSETEADMLKTYLNYLSFLKPGLSLTYNGDTYDKPYVIDRVQLNNIKPPPLGHIRHFRPRIRHFTVTSPLNREFEHTKEWITPDCENIDMVLFFRRFYPGLPNNRLETISQFFMGIGKTGLDYEEMFEIIRTRDPIRMPLLINYSFTDSVLLYELEKRVDVINHLTKIANDLCITRPEILRLSDEQLLRVAIEKLDPFYVDMNLFFIPVRTSPISEGIYLDVTSYDYNKYVLELFRNFMLECSPDVGISLYNIIKNFPTPLIVKLIYSSQLPDSLRDYFWESMKIKHDNSKLIGFDSSRVYMLKRDEPINSLLNVPREFSSIISISDSTIRITTNNQLEYYGRFRPSFTFVESYILRYIEHIKNGIRPKFSNIAEHINAESDKNKFVIKIKVRGMPDVKVSKPSLFSQPIQLPSGIILSSNTRPVKLKTTKQTVRYDLLVELLQHGIAVSETSWTFVKYIKVINGYHIILSPNDIETVSQLDVNYYTNETSKFLTKLDNLKAYK